MSVILPRLPSGHTLFCDDIRFETSGKISLIGVYSADMFVKELPCVLPQLWASIYFNQNLGETRALTLRLILEVKGKDKVLQEVQLANLDSPPPLPTDEFQMAQMNIQLHLQHFQVLEEGRLKVRAYRDDDEIRLGTLDIRKAP
jgi:hypothetical protein